MDYLRAADRSWPLLTRLIGGHTRLYRATRGRFGQVLPGLPQLLLLDHVGARSGIKRTSPLLYLRDGDDVVLVASKGGYERNPGWLYNLLANPDTTVQIGSERIPVRARLATAAERARLWPKALELYPNFAVYQRRAEREIPVLILERRPG